MLYALTDTPNPKIVVVCVKIEDADQLTVMRGERARTSQSSPSDTYYGMSE